MSAPWITVPCAAVMGAPVRVRRSTEDVRPNVTGPCDSESAWAADRIAAHTTPCTVRPAARAASNKRVVCARLSRVRPCRSTTAVSAVGSTGVAGARRARV
ncbi:Uncharacterised protein [Mycobacteroides abscessus subsp. abscessus]|nr:Uncharacterised protein [Mycobacteroides abscessus subsp. abscessus]